MTSWDIYPLQVQGVLARTAAAAAGFDQGGKALSNGLEAAASGAASAPINQALAAVAEQLMTSLQGAASRTGTALTGTVTATQAYLDGDLTMAADAQRTAAGIIEPDMPGHGMRRAE